MIGVHQRLISTQDSGWIRIFDRPKILRVSRLNLANDRRAVQDFGENSKILKSYFEFSRHKNLPQRTFYEQSGLYRDISTVEDDGFILASQKTI